MSIKIFLWVLVLCPLLMVPKASLLAQNRGGQTPPSALFHPDFSGKPTPLPKGTPLRPLCAHPGSPSCLPQWSHQALPLSVHPQSSGQMPRHEYFLPAFIPSSQSTNINPVGNPQWKRLSLPRPSYSTRPRQRSGRSRHSRSGSSRSSSPALSSGSNTAPNPARASSSESSADSPNPGSSSTEANPVEPAVPQGASSDESVSTASDLVQGSRAEEGDSPGTDPVGEGWQTDFYVNEDEEPQVIAVTSTALGRTELTSGTVAFVPFSDIQPAERSPAVPPAPSGGPLARRPDPVPPAVGGGGATAEAERDGSKDEPDPLSLREPSAPYRTARDTVALPATLKEVQSGCFVLDKPPETEAGFCFFCNPNDDLEEDSVLSQLLKEGGKLDKLKDYLRDAVLGYQVGENRHSGAKGRAYGKIAGSDQPVQKICAPEKSLRLVIENFQKSCKPVDFEIFFERVLCESCKKAIPPELMMAMMSVESAGECKAHNTKDENSMGLFQVNADVHGCYDLNSGQCHAKGIDNSRTCLTDPVNNMAKSLDILLDHYEQVNPQTPDGGTCLTESNSQCLRFEETLWSSCSQDNCPSWNNMSSEDRDLWHRGVAAYNAGPRWIQRAIASAHDKRTLIDTSFLPEGRDQEGNRNDLSQYKKYKDSWEQMRVYFFIEKLSSGNQSSTGRKHTNTLSNIAHTEAVLGREFETSYPPLVEVWAQYKEKFIEKNGAPQCN